MSRKKSDYMNKRFKEGFFKQSKKENVRARSYFKLEQLDKKFNLFSNVSSVLDLGCAPGGWCEYVDSLNSNNSNSNTPINIIGVDILPIRKKYEFSKYVEFIEDDFNNLHYYSHVLEIEFDCVISDMSPEFSGDISIDKGRVHNLNIQTITLSQKHLKKGGNLIFKTFEGTELQNVKENAKKYFKEIKEYKPQSSQLKSAETFIVCLNKK